MLFDPAARTLALRILSASLETKGLEAPVTGEQQIRQSLARLLPTRLLGFDDIGSEEGVAVASACGAKVNGHGHDGLVVENALAREVGRRAQRALPAHHSLQPPCELSSARNFHGAITREPKTDSK